jgi:hypothetical protein
MKATMITLAAILSFTMNVLFAGNSEPASNFEMSTVLISLAPAAPAEATFEEMPAADFSVLAPVTPVEAGFSDVPEMTANISVLAPVTPMEADFSADEMPSAGTINLSPVTPDSADFTEAI